MKRLFNITALLVLCLAVIPFLVSCAGSETAQKDAATDPSPAAVDPTVNAANTPAPADTPQSSASPQPTAVPQPTADPQPVFVPRERPETVTPEWLAEELMYRYYIGWINLELADFSDIMDRNRETDLFFYTNQYEIDAVRLGIVKGIVSPGPGTAEVEWIVDESETELTVHVRIEPNLVWKDEQSGGGTNFQITIDKQRMVIVAYDQDMCEGIYCTQLKPLAFQYRVDLPWEEADKKAYDELYAELEKSAEILNGQS